MSSCLSHQTIFGFQTVCRSCTDFKIFKFLFTQSYDMVSEHPAFVPFSLGALALLTIALLGVALPTPAGQQYGPPTPAIYDCVTPYDGMAITRDTIFCPGVYAVPNGITINASGIALNCAGATLIGDRFRFGYGIIGNGFSDITVRNCHIKQAHRGIYLISSVRARVKGNTLEFNQGNGVDLTWSGDSIISQNTFLGPGGLKVNLSASTVISDNNLYGSSGYLEVYHSNFSKIYSNVLASIRQNLRPLFGGTPAGVRRGRA